MKISKLFFSLLLISACNISAQSISDPDIAELECNKCFSIENGYDSLVFTDTISYSSKAGNSFKKLAINDSLFIWKCGRNDIEYIIDTFICGKPVESLIDWETDKFITITKNCGSYCWTNILYPLFKQDSVLYLSYSAIDFETYNVVIIGDENFQIKNLISGKEVQIPIAEQECLNMHPLFAIKEIKIFEDKLSYTIKCKDSTLKKREEKFRLIK